MRLVKFWAVAALLPLYACSADDNDMQPEPAPVVSAPQAQAPQAETAPTTEAQAEDVVEAGEEVAAETGSQSEIVLAQQGGILDWFWLPDDLGVAEEAPDLPRPRNRNSSPARTTKSSSRRSPPAPGRAKSKCWSSSCTRARTVSISNRT